MNLFDKAKQKELKPVLINCLHCNSKFKPDIRNLKRGWSIFCSRSCSTIWSNLKRDGLLKKSYIRERKIRSILKEKIIN